MSFCQNCGKELNDGARFCGNCGQDQHASVPATKPTRTGGTKRLHCPECKSHDISPVVETEVTGGTSLNHSFSKRNSVSAMQFNNTHRNYWMCSSCGCKFRNLQNLEEELKNTENLVKRGIIGIVLLVALMLFCNATLGFGFSSFVFIFTILLTVASIFVLKHRISKMREERAYLKKRCFN
ncbi:MAG: zinc ribbon domain-containing protein [Oscillospiraceae bacterium]|nr:zinc ribbon domain-containing protein [Oscillospiraceae bacterium]